MIAINIFLVNKFQMKHWNGEWRELCGGDCQAGDSAEAYIRYFQGYTIQYFSQSMEWWKKKKLDKFNSCHLIPFVIYYDYLFVFMRMPIAMSAPSVETDDGGMKQDLHLRLRVL